MFLIQVGIISYNDFFLPGIERRPKIKRKQEQDGQPPVESKHFKKPALQVDYARYEAYLTQSDLSGEEKRAFLDTLWEIICNFVSLGYNVHPVQDALKERDANKKIISSLSSEMLSLSDPKTIRTRKGAPCTDAASRLESEES